MRFFAALLAASVAAGLANAQIGPPPSGGGGTPGGAATDIQYNKASAFAGSSNSVYYDTALPVPGSGPTVAVIGTAGSSSIGYAYVPIGQLGSGLASPATIIANSQTTGLNGTNYNTITTAAVAGSTSCDVYRINTPAELGYNTYVGNVTCGSSINDQTWGAASSTSPNGTSVLPQVDNSAGVLLQQNLRVTGNAAFGSGDLGSNYQRTAGRGVLNVAQTNIGSGSYLSTPDTSGIASTINLTPAGQDYISNAWGIQSFLNIPASNTYLMETLTCILSDIEMNGSGPTSADAITATLNYKGSADNSGNYETGVNVSITNTGSGTVGYTYGSQTFIGILSGADTNVVAYGTSLYNEAGGAANSVTNWVDFDAEAPTFSAAGAIANYAGVKIADASGLSGTTTNYGLESLGTAQKNLIAGQLLLGSMVSKGTQFTASGSGASPVAGGTTAGTFTVTTTGAASVVVTMGAGQTAPTGWACSVNDETTANLMRETASNTTTATFAGTTVSGDTIVFGCMGY